MQKGSSPTPARVMEAGFWWGLQPYLSSGEQDPFRFLHHPSLKSFGGIPGLYRDGLLSDDLAAVRDLIDKVDCGPGDAHAPLQGGFMHFQAVEPLTAEGGDQGRMNVQDPFVPSAGELRGENGQEPGQHNQPDPVFRKRFFQRLLPALPVRESLFFQGQVRDAGLLGPHQGIGGRLGREHQGNVRIRDFPAGGGVQDGLQIGAAAGNQHGCGNLIHTHLTRSGSCPSPFRYGPAEWEIRPDAAGSPWPGRPVPSSPPGSCRSPCCRY